MQGQLFTEDFLETGIVETEQWRDAESGAFRDFQREVTGIFKRFGGFADANEAATEGELIEPILKALGWTYLPQQSAGKDRSEIPDYLLFENEEKSAAARKERKSVARFKHGIAIVEAKRWQKYLDRGREPDLLDDGVPSTQMLRYMSRAEIASERAIQWGILTNGRHWRLYYQGARSRSEEFLEIDLGLAAGAPGAEPDLFSPPKARFGHHLQVFFLMFRREAFLPTADGARSFHQFALGEARQWEARVAESLSSVVFDTVFPELVDALAQHDPRAPRPLNAAYLEEARAAALTLLYRLLFILYAEDRRLLPAKDVRYDDYALTRMRENIRDRMDRGDALSATQRRYDNDLKQLFGAIHAGDEALGIPPYNGGLFDPAAHALLQRAAVPDAVLAPLIDRLSRREEDGKRKWINYRDLSVRQLGSIYERLLEFAAVIGDDGGIVIRPNPFARKTSGSYYTHDDLVALIVMRTLDPLLKERWDAFQSKAEELRRSRRPKAEKIESLRASDPASAILELKVCDPAMGSGHFLVGLVDYLADRVLQAIADAAAAVDWADPAAPYRSPLVGRIETIRAHILDEARKHKWTVRVEQLDDRQIVRRIILKRVIYGVDKNPMAVELAKVSLWLHTFTVGAPLSFLDHHLRCGDSLFGEWIGPTMREMADRFGLFLNESLGRARGAITGMQRVESLTDADIAEVRASSLSFHGVTEDTEPLRRFLDFRHALRWLGHHSLRARTVPQEVVALLDGGLGDPVRVISGAQPLMIEDAQAEDPPRLFADDNPRQLELGKPRKGNGAVKRAAADMLAATAARCRQERFLHWQVAFPGVWRDWESVAPVGGFDAVVGNPPWDRVKLQEVEWFAARRPEIAHATRADERRRMVARLKDEADPLWQEYEAARAQAEGIAEVARANGDYPLLSGGDVNLYALFVERAHALIKPDGIVGLLVPSGIASDLTASEFFKSIATAGRLAALFDFENRKIFFPDIDSRFKFSVFVSGGTERNFAKADCAFYLHSVEELEDADRRFALAAEDFAAVNPNTGTAPVFRRRRDAELTAAIYKRVSVLVDRRHDPPKLAWPVRYLRMFDMTNDAALFKTRVQLEAAGFYPAEGNRWKKGKQTFVPLYEGKMVQAYDHRAASVTINPQNLNRPAQPLPASFADHENPSWVPTSQFWIDEKNVEKVGDLVWTLTFKEITAPTNVRTMIALLAPLVGFGNKVPLLLPATETDVPAYIDFAPLLVANFNSFAFDFATRQKVHGQTINLFILEQLPVIEASAYRRPLQKRNLSETIKREVLHLTYTSHDMTSFARDMGYDGAPFRWDNEDRRHRRARLDAIYFHLYGIGRADAAYILDTFPIVRDDDERAFGRYLTKDLILAYMNAVADGDFDTVIAV